MNPKKITLLFFIIIPLLFLSFGSVFALEVNWPTIGGISIKSGSGIGEVARYFFALATATGSIVMFGMIIKGGFDFMNAGGNMGKISKAKTQMIGSAIGMIILLGAFIILNNINPALISPKDVETDCPLGIRRKVTIKYKDDKKKDQEKIAYLCYNTDQANLMEDITGDDVSYEDLGSTFPHCFIREIITFPEKNYEGERKVIYKDEEPTNVIKESCPDASNIKLGDAKSVKIILKKDGAYLYGRNNILPKCGKGHLTITKDTPPTELCVDPSIPNNLRKEDDIWKWECIGDGDIKINCWTKPDPSCKDTSIKVSGMIHENATFTYLYNGNMLGAIYLNGGSPIVFNWDGETPVSLSGSPEKQNNTVGFDDSVLIINETNGKKKFFLGDDHNSVWIGDLSITDILSEGSNSLKFIALDTCGPGHTSGHDCIGVDRLFILYCPEKKVDDTKEDDKVSEPVSMNGIGPLFYNQGENDFSKDNFNDKARILEIVNTGMLEKPVTLEDNIYYGEYYGTVLFSEAEYRGKCFSHSYDTIQKELKHGSGESLLIEKDIATGKKVDLRNNLSSMIVFKSPLNDHIDKTLGKVEFYAVPNCGNVEKKASEDNNKYDVCTVYIDPAINGYVDGVEKIFFETTNNSACRDNFKDKSGGHYPIQSFRINGSAGVVLKSDAGNCHYFDIKTNPRGGNCFTNLQDTFKTFLGEEKIKSVMVIPLQQQ